MKCSVCFLSLITVCIIPKIYSQNPKVPGCAGCGFFGATMGLCGELIPAASLPPECEALFYFWIHTDETLQIIDYTDEMSNKDYIIDLDTVGKPIYLYYGRSTIDNWMPVLSRNSQDGGENIKKELTNLKTYLSQYKNMAGLVLNNFTPDINTTSIPDMTKNFKVYLDEMKKTLPNYAIGMEIISRLLIDLNESPNPPVWLDFKDLDPCIDFYILDLYYFNDCTEDLKIGGATPICGDKGRTLEKLVETAKKVGIPQSKIYFGFRSGAIEPDPNTSLCDVTNTKGTFAKNNGVGFVMSNVDIADDPNGLCQCGTPYPAFYDVLAGFKGAAVPKPCPLLDKK